ncbi:unnamed protein product [Peniophora sp. CBMAI 1063]|nr:unnamed protein product [Peniophora sp. CBMAI 1063]
MHDRPTGLQADDNGVSAACVLEWNFFASRINSVLSLMRAHRDLNMPLDLRYIADGLTIERAYRSLVSGRLAIQGQALASEAHQNHDLAFRHSVDKGMRVLQGLLQRGIDLPRWGSLTNDPPPPFMSLRSLAETDQEAWQYFWAASGLDENGSQWWKKTDDLNIQSYDAVKSLDAARAWFRLHVGHPIAPCMTTPF